MQRSTKVKGWNVSFCTGRSFFGVFFSAYLDVRCDKSETNWLLLDYEVWAFFFLGCGSLVPTFTDQI